MDSSVWELLHDGVVEAVERQGDRLVLDVAIEYLTELLEPGAGPLRLTLVGLRHLRFTPYDGEPTEDPAALADLELLSARCQDGRLEVCTADGTLELAYAGVDIHLADGSSLTVPELEQIAAAYWADWEARNEASRADLAD